MAKSVLDSGWATFKAMLNYKASRHSALFIEVDERFTTQTCSHCNAVSGPKGIAGLGIREWVCLDCGKRHDRDVNSATNILAIGRSVLPPVGESRLALRNTRCCVIGRQPDKLASNKPMAEFTIDENAKQLPKVKFN
jgi:transposase